MGTEAPASKAPSVSPLPPSPTQTCALGRCADDTVAEGDIETYDQQVIFGGYDSSLDAARHGACFDAVRCFDDGQRVQPDLDKCTFTHPVGVKTLNVGLAVKEDGHCNPVSGKCFIPLDESKAFGWTDDGAIVTLPGGVCDRLRDGRVLSVVITGSCDTKKITTPVCGPWLGPTGSNDRDNDGIADSADNCPDISNPAQTDTDRDGIGDGCDTAVSLPDLDADGIADTLDNCPQVANSTQLDSDKDSLGDACDSDADDDGVSNDLDPEPLNPFVPDADHDKVWDSSDNCPSVSNADQLDTDKDGQGEQRERRCSKRVYRQCGHSARKRVGHAQSGGIQVKGQCL
jgi:hypothetical protein